MFIFNKIKNFFIQEKEEKQVVVTKEEIKKTPENPVIDDSFDRIEKLPITTQAKITKLGNQLLGGILGKNTSNNKNGGRGRG